MNETTISISYRDGRHRDLAIQGDELAPLRVPADVAADWDAGEIERLVLVRLALPQLRRSQGPRSGISAVIGRWPGDESDEDVLEALEREGGFSPLGEALR
jgi:hypothetical protein